jgi:hypothetical protein
MSQVIKLADGSIAPGVEKLTGDAGGAIGPDAAFNINLLTGDGLTSTGAGNTITFTLDGYVKGSGQTIGAVTADLITIPMGAVAGVKTVEAKVLGFESTTPAGCGYDVLAVVRTTGAAAALVGVTSRYVAEEAALVGCDADIVVAGNNLIVRATGVAALTVNWKADITTLGV